MIDLLVSASYVPSKTIPGVVLTCLGQQCKLIALAKIQEKPPPAIRTNAETNHLQYSISGKLPEKVNE